MALKRYLILAIAAFVILLISLFSTSQLAKPTLAGVASPDNYWIPRNFNWDNAPVSLCYLENGKNLTMSFTLPMVQWQGVGMLSVYAKYKIYQWPGYATNNWPLIFETPNFQSGSNAWSPSFSFWGITPGIGCIGACYDQMKINYQLLPGTYFAKLELNITGSLLEYYVPFLSGNPVIATWYCIDPRAPSPFSQQQSASLQMDPLESSPKLMSELVGEPPPLPRFDQYLPFALRVPGISQQPTPQPQPTPTDFVAPLPTPSLPSTTVGIVDPGFESGPNGAWEEYSQSGYDIVWPEKDNYTPRSGSWMAWLGGANNEISEISQKISVPTSHPYLSFYALITSVEDQCHYDHANVFVDGNVVANFRFCKESNNNTWSRGYVDLRLFTGQEITITIRMENDESLLSSLFIDDISFESGIEPALAPPTPIPNPTATPVPPTATPSPAPGSAIRNPGFELGDNGDWKTFSYLGYETLFSSSESHSGNWLAWLGGANNEIGFLEQSMYVPTNQPILTYWGWVTSEETVCSLDYVSFIVNSSTIFSYHLCEQYNSSGWAQGWVNLSDYAGSVVTVQIRVSTNDSLLSSLYVDDFSFSADAPTSMSENMYPMIPDSQKPGDFMPRQLPESKP